MKAKVILWGLLLLTLLSACGRPEEARPTSTPEGIWPKVVARLELGVPAGNGYYPAGHSRQRNHRPHLRAQREE